MQLRRLTCRRGARGRVHTYHAAKDGAGASSGLLVRLANQALRRKVDLAPQGKTWECFLLGHAGLDVLTGEADRKRILLERFQAEVCGPKVHTHTLQGCRSSLKLKPPPPQTPGFDFSGAELSGAARDASTFMR